MSASNPLLHKNANRYVGFKGEIYPEHLVLNRDLHDFEDYRERRRFGGRH